MNNLKIIYFEPAWRLRKTSYIQHFFTSPPEGYRFVAFSIIQDRAFQALSRCGFSFKVQGALAQLLPLQLLKNYVEMFKKHPSDAVLTYALDHLVLRKEPWVLEMTFELPYVLCGSTKWLMSLRDKVRKILLSENCRKILFQLEKGREAFLYQLGEDLVYKTEVVPRGEFPRAFKKDYDSERIKILFVNSANISNEFSFYMKGGAEVVATFLKLNKSYENIELTLRTVIPNTYKKALSRFKNVKIIDKPIPWTELEKEWITADIFIHPHHGNLSHSLLDAMSYSLPVVASDTWATSEIIKDGKTGFLVHDPKAVKFTDGPVLRLDDPLYRKEILKDPDPEMVEELVEKTSTLIENPKLRRMMGEAAGWEVKHGKFSLKKKNEELKKILDEVTSNDFS
jgi:glycosyltransferase involved in cell wall biosynthesis